MRTDVSGWRTRLSDEMISRYTASGEWPQTTLVDHAMRRLSAGAAIAVVEGASRFSFAQVMEEARRLLGSMTAMGLKPGDVVSFQLPNWAETMVINLAACMGGFICNPIVPIYRDAEVGFILADARTKLLFIPSTFRAFDYVEMVERLHRSLPDLVEVVVVRGTARDCRNYCDLTAHAPLTETEVIVSDPNAIKLLLYTSGTTGNPKGVLHSHNTLGAEMQAVRAFWQLDERDVIFMASPVTHITGYLYALELAFLAGAQVVFADRWNADEAVRLIHEHAASFCVGATPFLAELTDAAQRHGSRLPSLRLFATGGAPVPPQVVRNARNQFERCAVFRIFGSSEAPTVTLGITAADDPELGATTDGRVANNDVRIIDIDTHEEMYQGDSGEVTVRGPEVMLGYTDPAETSKAFDQDGFFHTGDIGTLNANGYLTITGRLKDLIIRGGENISPRDVEDSLMQHPDIRDVTVVAMPHDRLGEGVCAYIIPREQVSIGLIEVSQFLSRQGIAKQKWPERIELVQEFPRTPAGKVRKNLLREHIAARMASEEAP